MAKRHDFASCELKGMDTVNLWMKDIKREFDMIPMVFLEEVTEHAAARAKLNAPILTGKLRLEIGATYPVRLSANVVEATVWSSTINPRNYFDYAQYQHEYQIPSTQPAPKWGRPLFHGEVTAAQPMTPEGGAGGKYIERVVNYHYGTYLNLLEQMVGRAMRAGSVRMFAGSLRNKV